MAKIGFGTGVEGVLPGQFQPEKPSLNREGNRVRLEGGRVPRYVDEYFDVLRQPGDMMLEFIRPNIKFGVTAPMMYTMHLRSIKRKLDKKKKQTRNIRKRQAVTRALKVLEDLDENVSQFQNSLSSLQKA